MVDISNYLLWLINQQTSLGGHHYGQMKDCPMNKRRFSHNGYVYDDFPIQGIIGQTTDYMSMMDPIIVAKTLHKYHIFQLFFSTSFGYIPV